MREAGSAMAGRIVALAGGVGGAKLAHGLQLALPDPRALAVIVNTGDDFELYGLHISPDLDTVMYTLSDLANPETGWGIRDETFATLHMIAQYGEEPWFQLGDRDFATHILRTAAMRAGTPLSEITGQMARNLDIVADLIPMTDDRVATLIDTPDGRLDFQEYFVARHHADAVHGIILDGIESATPTPAALRAIAEAEAIVFCPSNPFVSIGPILALAGLRAALDDAAAPVVVVSPIVGGEALKGPAATMMQGLGHEVSALGVARIYAGLADGVVIDSVDRELSDAIEALGMRVLITDTIMRNTNDREQLARETLAFAQSLTTT
ncbi:MAG: 2-phospho-L-lactate transferase [Thermomicrobiales bacterium]|nr:2-phospho-L-lactate transferase [Thermomicrobiales bacterium]